MSSLGQPRVASPDPFHDHEGAAMQRSQSKGSSVGFEGARSQRQQHSGASSDSRASTSSSVLDSPEGSFALPSQAHVPGKGSRRRSHASSSTHSHHGLDHLSAASAASFPVSARYVTVSSILSRSGAALQPADSEDAWIGPDGKLSTMSRRYSRASVSASGTSPQQQTRRAGSIGDDAEKASSSAPSKRVSNGSALEALGALFLQRDSTGKVSNLSFTRYARGKARNRSDRKDHVSDANQSYPTPASRSATLDFISKGLSGSATRLGIRMPKEDDAGQTIAQRRARRMTVDQDNVNGQYRVVGTKGAEPTFEVGIVRQRIPIVDDTDTPKLSSSAFEEKPLSPPPAPRLSGMNGNELTPPPIGQEEEDEDAVPSLRIDTQRRSFTHAPLTDPTAIYGPGSAFHWIEPPELPPSPIGMPGAWLLGNGAWTTKVGMEEGALLLPPPLLDDYGSDAQSFEGLLGVRRMREQERARKQWEKLKARNRPAHKVGMLTAFSNFVRAAHAADKAARASTATSGRRGMPPLLPRRHTEPHPPPSAARFDEEDDDQIEIADVSNVKSDLDTSIASPLSESAARSLDTVFEGETVGRRRSDVMSKALGGKDYRQSESDDDDDDDGDISDLEGGMNGSVHLSRRSSGRRRVPVRMSSTDGGEDKEASAFGTGPSTPRINPTMLSLPPSPWTPYGGTRSGAQTPFHVHLGMTHIFGGLPGTPRLMPALLEVMPSPFPTSSGMTPYLRSPRIQFMSTTSPTAATTSTTNAPVIAPSPLALSPHDSPQLLSTPSVPARLRRRKSSSGVLTASIAFESDSNLTPLTSKAPSIQRQHSRDRPKRASSSTSVRRASMSKEATPKQKRSFLLWFFFGDLGLGSRARLAAEAAADRDALKSHSSSLFTLPHLVLVTVMIHLYGFIVFVLAHLVDLGFRISEFLAMVFWFARWMTLNITGQTVLARCVIEAYALVAREWETVSKEDHEGKGKRATKANEDGKAASFKGLSRWQVAKGLIEFICLQDVTRERYLQEGAGLAEMEGWRRVKGRGQAGEADAEQDTPIDLGVRRAADRQAKSDELAARIRLERDGQDELHSMEEESDEEQESDSESSDDDMVVTHRGPDILEFTKTPRVERHSYFHSASPSYEDDDEPFGRDTSKTRPTKKHGKATETENRQMVKMIKWASRLAISAYGLHVTLVDLPPTFTPSGDRFSRQTFAHLSRLHHEDVLHADIQTLDADDYSPTFYLVRDYSRKVVAVSVRGTQSLQDIIVDLELVVDQVKLHLDETKVKPGEDENESLYCHAGILRAARALIAPGSTLFRTLNQALREHPDFGIVFTGHSLGGAIASTVVLLLSRFEAAVATGTENNDSYFDSEFRPGRWLTHDQSGLPAGRPIRAITFAHPATFSAKLASRAAQGTTPLVLSLVLGHDIIPRCGHGQARELRRVLGALSRVRRRKEGRDVESRTNSRRASVASLDLGADDQADDEEDDDARVHIVTSWRIWRSIQRKGKDATDEEVRKAQRIEKELWHLRCNVENDLYSAVKRRSEVSQSQSGAEGGEESDGTPQSSDQQRSGLRPRAAIPPSPWIEPWQRAKAPLHQLTARRQALDAITLANEESVSQASGVLVPGGRSIWLYKNRLYQITSPLSFFSLPDFHSKMFSEHFPSAYEDALMKL